MQPGIYSGISADAYRSHDGISTSFLKDFADSPKKARFGETKESPSLTRGTLVHCAILEPAELERQYQPTSLTREGTNAWAAEEQAAMGKRLVKQHAWETALRMRDAVQQNFEAAELLAGVEVEQSFWWIDPGTGLLRKGRADAINRAFHCIVDVKTGTDCSERGFRAAVTEWKYHWQEAAYTDGYEAAGGFKSEGFPFIVVEPTAPFLSSVNRIDPEDIEIARADLATIMPAVKACFHKNKWPTNRDGVRMLDRLPPYAHLGAKTDLSGLWP